MDSPKDIEAINYQKFEGNYSLKQLSISSDNGPDDYFYQLTRVRMDLLRPYLPSSSVLDVGCGSGDYLFELKDVMGKGTGIDYTQKAIEEALLKKQQCRAEHLEFIRASARDLPFKDGCFDLTFSFSVLPSIPQQQEAVKEMARVTGPKGIVILELGNLWSLNTIVCRSCPELIQPTHLRLSSMRRIIKDAGLLVLKHRSFGILPFWEQRPRWLGFFLHPCWKRFFQKRIGGKMIDEWVSNSFIFRPWSYRHFFICCKQEGL